MKKTKAKAGIPTRSQVITDAIKGGTHWSSGQLPPGGFRAVIPFNTRGPKDSSTTKPEKGS